MPSYDYYIGENYAFKSSFSILSLWIVFFKVAGDGFSSKFNGKG